MPVQLSLRTITLLAQPVEMIYIFLSVITIAATGLSAKYQLANAQAMDENEQRIL